MSTTPTDPPAPATAVHLTPLPEYTTACRWYARCGLPAIVYVEHPILDPVPACPRCMDRHELWDWAIMPELPCPFCGADPMDPGAECLHVWCPVHKTWTMVDAGASANVTGFAGGTIYHTELLCGCVDHDESDDVRAAR